MTEPGAVAGLSERLAWLRKTVFGPRGRAAFARAIGVSPSTYNYYEKGRPAPAELLAKVATVTGADLKWLLTGTGAAFPESGENVGDIGLSHQAREILARFSPPAGAAEAHAATAALRALLARIDKALPVSKGAWQPRPAQPTSNVIPIVGRTAAGLLAAWEECFAGKDDPLVMERLIRHVEGKAACRRDADLRPADPHHESDQPADTTAILTQLSSPTPDGVVEFLELPGAGPLLPGTFALRVDGDSMAPRLMNGDIVVSHREAAPEAGMAAIVKIRDRIGVTAKLWRPEGDRVHLIPINEAYEPAVYPRRDILWACRILWVVRL